MSRPLPVRLNCRGDRRAVSAVSVYAPLGSPANMRVMHRFESGIQPNEKGVRSPVDASGKGKTHVASHSNKPMLHPFGCIEETRYRAPRRNQTITSPPLFIAQGHIQDGQ